MRTLLRIDPGRATELSRRCRQLAQSRYAEEVVAKRYIDLYVEVMRTFAMSNARARS
jgi:hypothetical protein